MPNLFDPLTLRSTTFQNRVWVSPMCQYSATNGLIGQWHPLAPTSNYVFLARNQYSNLTL
ncbi:MAG: hypothetical protein F2637_03545 [Actinobacteria bacterium]|nr:hypothetical protein [Actinomycetota bacterium]